MIQVTRVILFVCFCKDKNVTNVVLFASGSAWSALSGNNAFNESGLSYDKNGNILTLTRGGSAAVTQVYTYTGNQLTGLSRGNVTGSYLYDKNGNLVNDSRKNLNLTYNVLNLLSAVKTGTTPIATYSYLADGTKLDVVDGSNNGFCYLGSLTYVRNGSNIQLESGLFGGGRIVANASTRVGNEIRYFLTDHLGSVRVIVDQSSSVKERNDYYPFGGRYAVSGGNVDAGSRWKYNGKEDQVTGGLGWLDYGARMYDWELGRWFGMDILSERYYSTGNYCYCLNRPILFVDPNGCWSSTHTDWAGNVIAVFDDGDLGVYRHKGNRNEAIVDLLFNYNSKRTFGGGKKMGETWTPLGFADFDYYEQTGKISVDPRAFIDYNSFWASVKVASIIRTDPSALDYAVEARENHIYDIKWSAPGRNIYYGSDLFGKYASARDAGNFAAGAVAQMSNIPNFILDYGFGLYNFSGNKVVRALGIDTFVSSLFPFSILIKRYIRKYGEDELSRAGQNAGKKIMK